MTAFSVLIVGGSGLAGRNIASALLDSSDAAVVLGGRDADRLHAATVSLSAQSTPGRVSSLVVNAADAASVADAVKTVDLVVLAAQARYGPVVARAAVDARVDVIDVTVSTGDEHPMAGIAAAAEAEGCCLVTEAGAFPGLPAVLVRVLAARFERLDTVLVGHVLNQEGGLPDGTVDEIVEDIGHPPAFVWDHGAWRRSRIMGMQDRRKFDFGSGWGRRSCLPLMLREMRSITERYPSLQEAGAFVTFSPMVQSLALPVVVAAKRMAAHRAQRPATRFTAWALRHSRPPYGFALKVDATGQRNGVATSDAITVTHADGYRGTGTVVAALVAQWRDRAGTSIRVPGLHPMGMLVEPVRFIDDLRASSWRIA